MIHKYFFYLDHPQTQLFVSGDPDGWLARREEVASFPGSGFYCIIKAVGIRQSDSDWMAAVGKPNQK